MPPTLLGRAGLNFALPRPQLRRQQQLRLPAPGGGENGTDEGRGPWRGCGLQLNSGLNESGFVGHLLEATVGVTHEAVGTVRARGAGVASGAGGDAAEGGRGAGVVTSEATVGLHLDGALAKGHKKGQTRRAHGCLTTEAHSCPRSART